MRERALTAERQLRRILHILATSDHQRPDAPPTVAAQGADAARSTPSPFDLTRGFDYAAFAERFRGAEEDIKERQKPYVEHFRGLDGVLDIGCGRGEFLELLREAGIRAKGVDIDLDMVLLCREKGLDVEKEDASSYLQSIPDRSLGGVFAAQVIEHLPPRQIIDLVKLCHRKLTPGGMLILETPNPRCLMVFAESFYKDPSHLMPAHPDTMTFLLEAAGFRDVNVMFSAPVDPSMRVPALDAPGANLADFNQGIERVNSLLFGHQDYAVIGRRGFDIPLS